VVVTGSSRRMTMVIVGMACVSLFIGFGAERFVKIAKYAADETLDRAGYVANVRAANEISYPAKTPGGREP
jgi:hypothetical protein